MIKLKKYTFMAVEKNALSFFYPNFFHGYQLPLNFVALEPLEQPYLSTNLDFRIFSYFLSFLSVSVSTKILNLSCFKDLHASQLSAVRMAFRHQRNQKNRFLHLCKSSGNYSLTLFLTALSHFHIARKPITTKIQNDRDPRGQVHFSIAELVLVKSNID